MSEMVDRVSQAMREACPFELRDQTAHSMARAAIEAMRVPSQTMLAAGSETCRMLDGENGPFTEASEYLADADSVYRDMIEAALKP